VSAEKLRRAVQRQVGPPIERALQDGRRERRVDHQGGIGRARDLIGHGPDVDEVERRVGRRFDDHERGVRAKRIANGVRFRVRHVHVQQPARQEVVGRSVERANGDDVTSDLAGSHEHGRHRRHAGAVGHAVIDSFQLGDAGFAAGNRRVVQPRVHRLIGVGRTARQGLQAVRRIRQVLKRIRRREVDRGRVHAQIAKIAATAVNGRGRGRGGGGVRGGVVRHGAIGRRCRFYFNDKVRILSDRSQGS
jgi:hypothetical protein